MLWNPLHDHPIVSRDGLITWLRTMPPDATFKPFACDGTCLFSQYLMARTGTTGLYGTPYYKEWVSLHEKFGAIIVCRLITFGRALAKLEAMR